ncbi:TetR/AcrR family transcriptional regulator [Kiritimatiellota bacterium B12222]|nr:TetR/AcrR family transcriptional regulator [Kiritimatiellota bacterium B12222]
MKEQSTKERILETAEALMLEKSFHAVGLKQILDAVKVPKGSFYHYFESKEQFGAEMLKHYVKSTTVRKRQMLLSEDVDENPITRLFAYLDGGVAHLKTIPGKFPCLVLKLAAEVSDLSDPMRQELAKGFEEWIGIFKQLLDEAIDKQLISEKVDSAHEAQLIQDLWNGATQRAVINQSVVPVEHACERIKSRMNEVTI